MIERMNTILRDALETALEQVGESIEGGLRAPFDTDRERQSWVVGFAHGCVTSLALLAFVNSWQRIAAVIYGVIAP